MNEKYEELMDLIERTKIEKYDDYIKLNSEITRIIDGLSINKIYDLKIKAYNEKKKYEIECEKNNTLYVPIVLLIASVLSGIVGSLSSDMSFYAFLIPTLYLCFCAGVCLIFLVRPIIKHKNEIDDINLLMKIIDKCINNKK